MSVPAHAIPFEDGDAQSVPSRVMRIRSEMDWTAPLPARAGGAAWRLQRAVKRALDIVLAAVALIVCMPLLAVAAILIRTTSRGPVLYEWRVLGRHAQPFTGYKLRTMVVNADELKAGYAPHNEMSGPAFKIRDDPRVTPVGRWLRRFSIDELPQLWSVLKGDMSLVGPRPTYAAEFVEFEPWQWGKLAVTPGITCLWQIGGRADISDFSKWAALDLEYIQRWSLWLDLRILLATVPAVLRGRGAY